MRATIIRELTDDLTLVYDIDLGNALAVMDSDGELVIHVPKSFSEMEEFYLAPDRDRMLLVWLNVIQEKEGEAYNLGIKVGRVQTENQFQSLMGVDKIHDTLKDIVVALQLLEKR